MKFFAILAVGRVIYRIAGVGQRQFQLSRQIWVVFNKQDAQRRPFPKLILRFSRPDGP